MQTTTLKNRLAKRYIGSKSTVAYKVLIDLINGWNNTNMIPNNGWNSKEAILIRPVYVSGAKRFASNQDHTLAITRLLDLLGVKYESGNDAPRGGLTGNYIKILTKIEY